MFVAANLTTGFHTQYIRIITVSLHIHSLCGTSFTVSKHTATVLSCYHINITLTQ